MDMPVISEPHHTRKGGWIMTTMRILGCGLAAALVLSLCGPAQAQQWGTIKGQVVLDGKIPEREVLKVNKDEKDCLAEKKKLLSEEWVVDEKSKGVKWVYVYLIPDTKVAADLIK